MSLDPEFSPPPHYGTPPEPPSRNWYQKRRFLLPITAAAAFGLGAAFNANSAASSQQAAAPAATTTVTSTTTSTQQATPTATVTATVTAKPSVEKVTTVVQADDQAVQDVLNAWQVAGPRPDQQAAAMAKLRRDWPTLAKALETATGVKAPATTRTRSAAKPATGPKPAPKPTSPPDVYYANCTAVRAAGAAPLYAGEPGYRAGLDRDGDGVACE